MDGQGWKRWSRWLLWWRTDPEEMRLQIDRYATLGVPRSARGFGLVIAFAMGLGQLWLSGFYVANLGGTFANAMSAPGGMAKMGLAAFLATTGIPLFPLGWLVYRGSRAAILAVMALWTATLALVTAVGWRLLPWGQEAMLFTLSLIGWAMCLHALSTSLAVEREGDWAA